MRLDNHLVGVSSSPETGELYKALNKAQQKFSPIKRSGVNKLEGFKYPTLRDICDATMPGLLSAGFTMPTFQVGFDTTLNEWVMVGTLCHESGQWISSVCPLLLGYGESNPGIQVLEIGATYCKKVLMQGLCGGWLESEEGEPEPPKPEPKPEVTEEPKLDTQDGQLPKPVKQKRSRGQAITPAAADLLKRAEEALIKNKGNDEATKKVLDYLQKLVDQGQVPSSQALLLTAKYVLDAKVTDIEQMEVADAE